METFSHNAITTVFLSVPGNIAQSLNNDRACEDGTMVEVNFQIDFDTDRKSSYYYIYCLDMLYCVYCLDMLKTCQRENILFEPSRDTNRTQLKIRKNDFTLQ